MSAMNSMSADQVRRRTLVSGTIGAIVEWYEYTVYATAAALVFGPLFFPAMDPGISQIAALATFGVGFVARPLGAFVAGHLGDRLGRKSTLILTFAIMSVSTALIGMLPTYEAVGVLAPKDSVELHNLPLLITIKLKKREDTGELTNEIKGYATKEAAEGAPLQATDNTPPWRR